MEFKVNSGMWGMMFGVPCIVADNFLKLADEAQIKTLIYVLRNNNRICTSDEIARAIGITPEQAEEALLFWEQANVLDSNSSQENKAVFSKRYKIIKKLSFFCHIFHDFIITLLENKAVFCPKN